MLCQFTIKNYKSIRDENTFDMQAASIVEHSETLIQDIDGQEFLPVSAIYGPNGGGKSNVLEALQVLEAKVLRPIAASTNKGRVYGLARASVVPFMLSEEDRNKPTEFEVFFRTKAAEYRYVLHVLHEVVVYESLDRIKMETGRRSALFTRIGNDINLKGVFAKLKISEGMSETLPLLSYLGIMYLNNEVVKDVLQWFDDGIRFLNYGDPLEELLTVVDQSGKTKNLIIDMIKEMDIDIVDFHVEEKDDHRIDVLTTHVVDGYRQDLLLDEESSGTQKLFGLLPYIASSLVNGTTLVVDELDAKIHPALLRHIIEMYTNPEVNLHGAQLIFTSHDLSTMNSEVFRRDEIWFVAKGNQENSNLYSLVEFKTGNGEIVRHDAKYDKQYLEGKYGADPYLQRFVKWGELKNA